MFKNLFLPLTAVAAFIVVVGLLNQGKIGNFKTSPITSPTQSAFKEIKIGSQTVKVELAKTTAERSKGLGGRSSLEENKGMLFVFSPAAKPAFWMKDTNFAIDIIWIKNGKVIGINKNVQPQPGVTDASLKSYPAPDTIDYVLEVNAGFSDKDNIKAGDSVDLSKI